MKRIVVTGINRGIGNEIARQLISKGHWVFGITRLKMTEIEKNNLLINQSGRLSNFACDLEKSADIEQLHDSILAETSSVDVIIHNAAVMLDQNTSILELDDSLLVQTITINLLAAIRLSKKLIDLLEKSSSAHIIHVSSGLGAINAMSGGHGAYRLSKTALNALTLILSSELSNKNIRVNSMCPGWVKTKMGGTSAPREVSQGAETAVWLALENTSDSGKFFRDKQQIAW